MDEEPPSINTFVPFPSEKNIPSPCPTSSMSISFGSVLGITISPNIKDTQITDIKRLHSCFIALYRVTSAYRWCRVIFTFQIAIDLITANVERTPIVFELDIAIYTVIVQLGQLAAFQLNIAFNAVIGCHQLRKTAFGFQIAINMAIPENGFGTIGQHDIAIDLYIN